MSSAVGLLLGLTGMGYAVGVHASLRGPFRAPTRSLRALAGTDASRTIPGRRLHRRPFATWWTADTQVIDGGGLTVTAGFIDAHSHPSGVRELIGVNYRQRPEVTRERRQATRRRASEPRPNTTRMPAI